MKSPSQDVVARAVRRLVATGSNLEYDTGVIPGNDSGPSPKGAYATVLSYLQRSAGVPATTYTDTCDAVTVEWIIEEFSIQWYRDEAAERAAGFCRWVWTPTGLAEIEASGLTLYGCSGPHRVDVVISKHWEDRWQSDLSLGYRTEYRIETPAFVEAPIDFALDGFTAQTVRVLQEG